MDMVRRWFVEGLLFWLHCVSSFIVGCCFVQIRVLNEVEEARGAAPSAESAGTRVRQVASPEWRPTPKLEEQNIFAIQDLYREIPITSSI